VAMSWEVARASLDLLLEAGGDNLLIEFNGGEPLLEAALLERCVTYVEERVGPGRIKFVLTTNGTLLSPAVVSFLAAHDVTLQVSFDGVEGAQERRGAGTLKTLAEIFAVIRRDHPTYFTECLKIQAALMPSTINTLAPSCKFFSDLGVSEVGFYAVMGQSAEFPPEAFEALCVQMNEVAEDGARHWRRTGTIPIDFLRGIPGGGAASKDGFCCTAGTASGICVDTAGRAWACSLFASSLRPLSGMAYEASEVLDLGDVRDPCFKARMSALPEKAQRLPLLTRRTEKYSSHGACKDCEFLRECPHCPASTAHLPGNADPHRMDDFACAFTRAASRARRSFHQKTGGAALAAQTEKLRRALAGLADALERETQSEPRH
jgi:sulfatase maturation enzyme AslB (radical SAM superfamily)